MSAAVSVSTAGTPVNPTSDVVEFAFTTGIAKPASGDWKTGSWDGTEPRAPDGAYLARCLVGPGGTVELPVGQYTMWIRITDNPEVPVIPFGLLRIT
ncbi:hypothetical protein [Streptomyces cylindrosporus]|uniref:Uncharacterized protein n=1 Tax=Streptomyces cylindrosporus TaxID=2927583 RepID=A0ABS9YK46_9ACTN|nr:hypothetical protein [Streptomyces cylindrosporus]MCI3277643.1 hypothetical protein [Streptomyces cylindrosporus]